MRKSLVKTCSLLLALPLCGMPVCAQTMSEPVLDAREASFASVPLTSAPTISAPAETSLATPPSSLTNAPLSLSNAPPTTTLSPQSLSDTLAPQTPTITIPVPKASDKAGIETAPLDDLDPDARGLLSTANGGLGTNVWQDSSRAFIERLLASVDLPGASPTLNHLARRLLLTTTQVPEGKTAGDKSLTALRVKNLLSLGDTTSAWDLAHLGKTERLDDETLLNLSESMMLTDQDAKICEDVKDLMKNRDPSAWQKLLILCQMKAKDLKPAQLGVDLMKDQSIRDEVFIDLANKNIFATSKNLPRTLTPLRPTTLALLRQIDLPLPPEVYSHADPALVYPLIQTKPTDDRARLAMAEKAAARGLLTGADLAAVYRATKFPTDVLSNTSSPQETGASLTALLYQQALLETSTAKRIALARKIMVNAPSLDLAGALSEVLADLLKDVTPSGEFNRDSAFLTCVFALAGKNDVAATWYKIAHAATSISEVSNELHKAWPLLALSGLVADTDYMSQMAVWTDSALKGADAIRQAKVGAIFMLLEAQGFAIPNVLWSQVIANLEQPHKMMQPSPLLVDRLRQVTQSPRKGEAVVLALLLANANPDETPFYLLTDAVRALRFNGLPQDSQGLAREILISLNIL